MFMHKRYRKFVVFSGILAVSAGSARAQTTLAYTITDLGTLGGRYSFANGINNAGQIAGSAYLSGDSAQHATLFGVSGGTVTRTDLSTLGGTNSYAYGINDAGQVAGTS